MYIFNIWRPANAQLAGQILRQPHDPCFRAFVSLWCLFPWSVGSTCDLLLTTERAERTAETPVITSITWHRGPCHSHKCIAFYKPALLADSGWGLSLLLALKEGAAVREPKERATWQGTVAASWSQGQLLGNSQQDAKHQSPTTTRDEFRQQPEWGR